MRSADLFSQPKPLTRKAIFNLSPLTISVCMTAGVYPALPLESASATIELLKYPFLYPFSTPLFIAFFKSPLILTPLPSSRKTTGIPVSWQIASFSLLAIRAFLIIISRAFFAFLLLSLECAASKSKSISGLKTRFAFRHKSATVPVIFCAEIVLIISYTP